MRVLMIAFGHPDNVLSLSKHLSSAIDLNLLFIVSGDLYEEGVLSMSLENLQFGLNSYDNSFIALPENIKKYLGNDFKIRIFRSYDRKLLKDKKFRNLRKLITAANIIRKENFDLIHYNGISGGMLYLVIFLKKFRKVWTLHDYIHHTGEENRKALSFQKILVRFNFHFIQHYEFLCKQLISFYNLKKENVSYVPSGPLTIFSAFEPKFLIAPNVKYILFFGRISKYKGIDNLISAFNQITMEFPDLKLIIAGSGNLWFEPGKNDNIIFLNRYIKTSELVGLIKNALFIVAPYKDSTHSAVIATSFTFLKPVIAANVGGLSEVVKDGITGFLVPPKNSHALALRIKQLITDIPLLGRMQDNIKSITTSGEYSWARIVLKMQELYDSILSESAGR